MKNSKKSIKQLFEILGPQGRICSSSKSCGPAMAIYNANVVVDEEIVWYGDVDVDISRDALLKWSKDNNKTVDIYYESALRVWNFENNPKKKNAVAKQNRLNQKKNISEKNGLVWTTDQPNKWNKSYDYDEIKKENEKIRNANITERLISYGVLTPGGTEWTWYNTWFYKSFYLIYEYFASIYRIYVRYPLYVCKVSDGGFFSKIKTTFVVFVREIGYQHNIKYLQDFWRKDE